MNCFTSDPYEGARAAFQVVYPHATCQDWEEWTRANTRCEIEGPHLYQDVADLCRRAFEVREQLSDQQLTIIAYAAGAFEALHSVTSAFHQCLPYSGCVAHHAEHFRDELTKYQTGLPS